MEKTTSNLHIFQPSRGSSRFIQSRIPHLWRPSGCQWSCAFGTQTLRRWAGSRCETTRRGHRFHEEPRALKPQVKSSAMISTHRWKRRFGKCGWLVDDSETQNNRIIKNPYQRSWVFHDLVGAFPRSASLWSFFGNDSHTQLTEKCFKMMVTNNMFRTCSSKRQGTVHILRVACWRDAALESGKKLSKSHPQGSPQRLTWSR